MSESRNILNDVSEWERGYQFCLHAYDEARKNLEPGIFFTLEWNNLKVDSHWDDVFTKMLAKVRDLFNGLRCFVPWGHIQMRPDAFRCAQMRLDAEGRFWKFQNIIGGLHEIWGCLGLLTPDHPSGEGCGVPKPQRWGRARRKLSGQNMIKFYKNRKGAVDFVPFQGSRILGSRMTGTVVILMFWCVLMKIPLHLVHYSDDSGISQSFFPKNWLRQQGFLLVLPFGREPDFSNSESWSGGLDHQIC